MDSFPSELPPSKGIDLQIVFFNPPYNTKRWIIDERDLTVMYVSFELGSNINLWCETNANQLPGATVLQGKRAIFLVLLDF